MRFGNISPMEILLEYLCLLFSLCVHEAGHAAMANYCGDPTARLLGRLTLDPRKHVDPFGTFLFPLIALSTGVPLIGWAKPVPINPRNFHNMRRDQVLVAMAGPGANVLLALAAVFLLRLIIVIAGVTDSMDAVAPVAGLFLQLIMINLLLAVFNLLPVPPLDGHYLVKYFVSFRAAAALDRIGPFGIMIAWFLARPWISLVLPPVLSAFEALLTAGMH